MEQSVTSALVDVLQGSWAGQLTTSPRNDRRYVMLYLRQSKQNAEVFAGGGTEFYSFHSFRIFVIPVTVTAPVEGRPTYVMAEVQHYWDKPKAFALKIEKKPGWWVMSGLLAVSPIDSDVKSIVFRRCNESERDALRAKELAALASDN